MSRIESSSSTTRIFRPVLVKVSLRAQPHLSKPQATISLEPGAAVDVDRDTVEVVSHRRREKYDYACDVGHTSDAAQRNLALDLFAMCFELGARHLRFDEAGC